MNEQPQDHFSQVAGDYATFRPRYPAELFAWLASIAPHHDLAWDAGTGNGQAAVALAAHFTRVVATDFSAGQIAHAIPHPHVEYQVAPADQSPLKANSAGLVTVAQALHWFEPTTFFREVQRVLVTRGAMSAWTYGVIHADEAGADQVLHDFYYREMGPWWPENRRLVEDGYRTIPFPFTRIPAPPFTMQARWSLDELAGYIGTWSAVSRFRNAERHDPIPELTQRLNRTWGDPGLKRLISWPLSVLVGRKA